LQRIQCFIKRLAVLGRPFFEKPVDRTGWAIKFMAQASIGQAPRVILLSGTLPIDRERGDSQSPASRRLGTTIPWERSLLAVVH
jgi:hypothetical protein